MARLKGGAIAALALMLGLAAPGLANSDKKARTPPDMGPIIPSERYGDWTVQAVGSGFYMATTTNDAGSVFGTACGPGSCTAILKTDISCEPDASYPALINTPGGAFASQLLCEKLGDLLVYSFSIDDGLTSAMSIGGVLGIAFPMESGEFKVSRFSLTGAAISTARIQQLSQAPAPKPLRQKAGDEFTL